jgi:hypothetical protein
MRTLCLAFVTAGVIFAQAPVPVAPDTAAADALRARQAELLQAVHSQAPVTLHPLLRIAPRTNNTTLPGVNPAPTAAAGGCAAPLIEMKAPAAVDSIARTPSPQAMADPITVQPPVPSCGVAAPVDANPYNIVPPVQAPK